MSRELPIFFRLWYARLHLTVSYAIELTEQNQMGQNREVKTKPWKIEYNHNWTEVFCKNTALPQS